MIHFLELTIILFNFLILAIITALLACWIILFISKTGIREYVQVNAPKKLSELFECDFCLSWWTCLFLALCASFFFSDWRLTFIPFCAAPITRYLL